MVVASCLCPLTSTLLTYKNRILPFCASHAGKCLFVWDVQAGQAAPDFTRVVSTSTLIWCSVPLGSIPVWFRCCYVSLSFVVSYFHVTVESCSRDTFAGGLAERGGGKTTAPCRRLDSCSLHLKMRQLLKTHSVCVKCVCVCLSTMLLFSHIMFFFEVSSPASITDLRSLSIPQPIR